MFVSPYVWLDNKLTMAELRYSHSGLIDFMVIHVYELSYVQPRFFDCTFLTVKYSDNCHQVALVHA